MTTDISENKIELGEFRPFAYYDQFLDCIRVYTHDRSVVEERLDDFITLYRCNHSTKFDPEYIGFSLKGVRHMLNEIGLSMEGAYKLAEILNALVEHRPAMFNSHNFEKGMIAYQSSSDLVVDFTCSSSERNVA